MAVVTKLLIQKRNKDYYNVFIDENFAFSIHQELVILYGIKEGKKIELEEIEEIIKEDNKKRAFNQSLNYLSYRRRTQWEIEDYLKKKQYDNKIIEEVIHKLYYYKMIDDKEYIKAFIYDKKSTNPIGHKKIIFDLKRKGISQDLLNNIRKWFSEEEEYNQAKELVIKYHKKYAKLTNIEKTQKIYQAGQRRGFSWEILGSVIRETVDKKDNFPCEENIDRDKIKEWAKKYRDRYEKRGFVGYPLKHKIYQGLSTRGYSWEDIEDIVGEILEKGY